MEEQQPEPKPVDRRSLMYAVHMYLYPWDYAAIAADAQNVAAARRLLLAPGA